MPCYLVLTFDDGGPAAPLMMCMAVAFLSACRLGGSLRRISSISPSSGLFGRSALPGITGGLAGDVLPAASLGPVVGS